MIVPLMPLNVVEVLSRESRGGQTTASKSPVVHTEKEVAK